MKIGLNNDAKMHKTTSVNNKDKKYHEDDLANKQDEENKEQAALKRKIGVKSIRKILRTLCTDSFPKEEMDLMIWVSPTI